MPTAEFVFSGGQLRWKRAGAPKGRVALTGSVKQQLSKYVNKTSKNVTIKAEYRLKPLPSGDKDRTIEVFKLL